MCRFAKPRPPETGSWFNSSSLCQIEPLDLPGWGGSSLTNHPTPYKLNQSLKKYFAPDLSSVLDPGVPEWVCKAEWRSTSVQILVPAKNEAEAKDKAWKKIARTEGGDSCLKITVLRRK